MEVTPYHQTPDVDLFQGDCRAVMAGLPEREFHCTVTSPPFFALRSYLPADHPDKHLELGSEQSPDEFVATLLEVFGGRDNPVGVWRVLRDDGVLFCNIGDSYASSPRGNKQPGGGNLTNSNIGSDVEHARWASATGRFDTANLPGFKPKDLLLVPWQLALALQAAGWYLRDVICWHKPSPMPGSQRDRCTSSWEPVLMLTKQARYFWDMEGVKMPCLSASTKRMVAGFSPAHGDDENNYGAGYCRGPGYALTTANPRNVWRLDWDEDDVVALLNYMNAGPGDGNIWKIANEGFSQAHFATFPKSLPAKCIAAATSERGCCPECGAPWLRMVDSKRVPTRPGKNSKCYEHSDGDADPNWHRPNVIGNRDPRRHTTRATTLGWKPGCKCGGEPVPCRVFDPFSGAGTTALAAMGLQRHCTLIELSEAYCEMIVQRLRAGLYATAAKRDDLAGQQTMFGD